MKLKDLKPNPKNPRTITDEKLGKLKKALAEFGSLDGFVVNRRTGTLISGHQRAKGLNAEAPVTIVEKYKKPTKTGTTQIGFIEAGGERFPYREVDWDETREKAAMIAANRGAGEWDETTLGALLRDIDDFGLDLDLTLFDDHELQDLMTVKTEPDFKPGSEGDQGQLDRKKPVECPECGHEFTT